MKRWSVPWRSFWFFSKQIIVFVTKYEACFGDSCLARKEEEKVVDCCWANPPFFVWNYVCCLCIHKNLPHTTCKWIRTRKYEKIHTYMLIVAVFLHTTVYKKGIWKRKKKLKKISNCAINNSVIWQIGSWFYFLSSLLQVAWTEQRKRKTRGRSRALFFSASEDTWLMLTAADCLQKAPTPTWAFETHHIRALSKCLFLSCSMLFLFQSLLLYGLVWYCCASCFYGAVRIIVRYFQIKLLLFGVSAKM